MVDPELATVLSVLAVLSSTGAWPVGAVSVAVIPRGADTGETPEVVWHGDRDRPYALASVTKLLTAYAVLLAVEEGAVELDDPAGPPGATVRHLLAHASGLPGEGEAPVAAPGARRIYSNRGYDVLGEYVARAVGGTFADYLAEGVLDPLGMTATELAGSPAHGGVSTARDLTRFVAELQQPRVLHASSVAAATTVAFPGLVGVVPGFGRQDPNDWGLGPELHARKLPHWMAAGSSPGTFGHFGQSGTFLWVDPERGVASVCLTDTPFGPWAAAAWPRFNEALLRALT